jgi:hypothetical protein
VLCARFAWTKIGAPERIFFARLVIITKMITGDEEHLLKGSEIAKIWKSGRFGPNPPDLVSGDWAGWFGGSRKKYSGHLLRAVGRLIRREPKKIIWSINNVQWPRWFGGSRKKLFGALNDVLCWAPLSTANVDSAEAEKNYLGIKYVFVGALHLLCQICPYIGVKFCFWSVLKCICTFDHFLGFWTLNPKP